MKPEATIMMPVRNEERFLPEVLCSALNQTYDGIYEVVLLNDASTDSTPRIAEDWARGHSNLRVLHQEKKSIGETRNRLLEESKGNFLFCVDADDRIHPQALTKVIDFYQRTPGVGLVYTDQRCISEEGKVLYEGRKAECHEYFDTLLYFTHFFGHLRSFRKDLIRGVKFDTLLQTGEDWDFIFQISPFTKKGHVPEILYDYRLNSEGISGTLPKEDRRRISVDLVKKYILAHNLYPGAQNIEVVVVADGDHAIHYEHIVDGKRTMDPKAKEALMRYFLNYKQPMN